MPERTKPVYSAVSPEQRPKYMQCFWATALICKEKRNTSFLNFVCHFPTKVVGKEMLWQRQPNVDKKHNPCFQRWRMVWSYSYHCHQLKSVEPNSVSPIPIEPDRENFAHRGMFRLTPVGSQLLSQICIVVPIVCNVLSSLTLALSLYGFASKRKSIESKSINTPAKANNADNKRTLFSGRSHPVCQLEGQRKGHQI